MQLCNTDNISQESRKCYEPINKFDDFQACIFTITSCVMVVDAYLYQASRWDFGFSQMCVPISRSCLTSGLFQEWLYSLQL